MARLLIAEDEPRLAAFLEKGLRAGGFSTTVVADGIGASAMAKDADFDLLILDLGLPGRDGLDVLRDSGPPATRCRSSSSRLATTPRTASPASRPAPTTTSESPFTSKSWSPASGHVCATTPDRREERHQISEGGITLDLRTRWVSSGSTTVELSAREFELLRTFLEHPNQVLSREQLLAHVWGYDYDPGSNVVDVYVGYLRRKLSVGVVRDGQRRRLPLPRRRRSVGWSVVRGVGGEVRRVRRCACWQ